MQSIGFFRDSFIIGTKLAAKATARLIANSSAICGMPKLKSETPFIKIGRASCRERVFNLV